MKQVNKYEVQITAQIELEKYFQCDCVKALRDNNQLYVEISNSPYIIKKYKENPDSFNADHYASFAALMVAKSLKDTEIDTFHIEIAINTGLVQVSKSLSYVTYVNVDIADKIELATDYCRKIGKGYFDSAKTFLDPALVNFLSKGKVDTLMREFQGFGVITDITLLNYWPERDKNLLFAVFKISFDSTKHGKFGFAFPLDGPKQINAYKLITD